MSCSTPTEIFFVSPVFLPRKVGYQRFVRCVIERPRRREDRPVENILAPLRGLASCWYNARNVQWTEYRDLAMRKESHRGPKAFLTRPQH